MQTVNMHEAKTHLSRLVEKASRGEPFIIARAGKPLVKVVAVDAPEAGAKSRFGFLKGMITVPESRQTSRPLALRRSRTCLRAVLHVAFIGTN